MAKRFDIMKNSSKKLKLDINVNSSYFRTNTSNIADFWGSDDDDFVLLATQLEEKSQRQPEEVQPKDEDLRFSQFIPQENTSTQQTRVEAMTTTRPCPALPSSQLLYKNEYEMPRKTTNPLNLSAKGVNQADTNFSFLPLLDDVQQEQETGGVGQWADFVTSQVTVNRRQLAQDRQLKFLMERVDVLKKENAKLQKDIIDRNNQTMTKDGEVSLLRNELRQTRKLLQASKVDKIVRAEEAERDCNKKVAEVFKQVIAKSAELNFTNVDFSEHKIRSANITFKETTMSADTEIDECRNMLRISNLYVTKFNAQQNAAKSKTHFYEYSNEKTSQKKQRSFFDVELEHLLFHHAQLQSQHNADNAIMDRLIMSVSGVFTEFWFYAQSLELPQHCMIYPYYHFDLQQDQSTTMRHSLIQPDILYSLERAVMLRRYIATLALICRRHCNVSQLLLKEMQGNYPILQIVIEAITKISYSFEVYKHFGVIEATGAFLHSLLEQVNAGRVTLSGSQEELLFYLLKQLVFTRPSPWVFRELSSCMLLCTCQNQLMSKMCVGSIHNCFVSDRVRSVYRFGTDSCLMQVYAGLLELCFYSDIPLKASHFKLLLSICGNHVQFVYKCFSTMPDFILKMIPLTSFIDDENIDQERILSKVGLQSNITPIHNNTTTDNNAALTPNNISELPSTIAQDQLPLEHACECYVKICLSVVTLVFQMMYQWTLQEEKTHVSQVSEISQIAVHLLILIFREYYIPNLFRDSEETTKHNLSLLCEWWKDNKLILKFEDTHDLFLKQLQEMQFMLKPLHQEANLSNLESDLAEWTRFVNNSDANIQQNDSPEMQLKFKNLFSQKKTAFFNSLKSTAYN